MNAAVSATRIAELPKADLHLHLEAAMRWSTLATQCAHAGVPVPALPTTGALEDFEEIRAAVIAVLRSPLRWSELAEEIMSDYAAQGVVHLEPSFVARNYRDVFATDEHCWMYVLEVFGAAAQRYGISLTFMAAVDRVRDTAETALELALLAVKLQPYGVSSFGLHSQEKGYRGERFAAAFRVAKQNGLLITPHAGESAGPESVREAIDVLQADRVQHGVTAAEDPELLARLADEQICLDVCPSSNVVLGVSRSLAGHQLPHLLRAGVPCSLAADDPIWFNTSIAEEYRRCVVDLGLGDDDLAALARASIVHSAAPQHVKDSAVQGVVQWLKSAPRSSRC